MEDIPSEEIINAVKEVLCQQISLSETDLVRETAKKFGYTRAVGTTESVISYTLKKALTARSYQKNQKAETSPQNNTQTNQNHRRELSSQRWFLFISVFPFLRTKLHLNHVLVDTVSLFKRLRLTLMLACTLNAAL